MTHSTTEQRILRYVRTARQQTNQSRTQAPDGMFTTYRLISTYPSVPRLSDKAALIHRLTEGRTYTPAEGIALELEASQRAFARRRELLDGSLTTPQVARKLGVTRQTPHDRVRKHTFLAVMDRGQMRFPSWQFDANDPNGVIAGLPDVLRALNVSPLAKVSWMTSPNPYLERRTPFQALKDGDISRVVNQALAVGVG